MVPDIKQVLSMAICAAEEASKVILEIYNSGDFQAELKNDNSPLTVADKRAHTRIMDVLTPSGLPVMSEEGAEIPYETRKNWDYFWMVDPLDGTKEFVKRNGEFTVNIALIHNRVPVLGVVAIPVTGELYYGGKSVDPRLRHNGKEVALAKRWPVDLGKPGIRVVASRSHLSEETRDFISRLTNPLLLSSGSSIKFMLIANGQADVYPRFAPTMEWDTAASHAIVNSVGMKVYRAGGEEELLYNKENLLNSSFICR